MIVVTYKDNKLMRVYVCNQKLDYKFNSSRAKFCLWMKWVELKALTNDVLLSTGVIASLAV